MTDFFNFKTRSATGVPTLPLAFGDDLASDNLTVDLGVTAFIFWPRFGDGSVILICDNDLDSFVVLAGEFTSLTPPFFRTDLGVSGVDFTWLGVFIFLTSTFFIKVGDLFSFVVTFLAFALGFAGEFNPLVTVSFDGVDLLPFLAVGELSLILD